MRECKKITVYVTEKTRTRLFEDIYIRNYLYPKADFIIQVPLSPTALLFSFGEIIDLLEIGSNNVI